MKQIIRKKLWSLLLVFALALSGLSATFTVAQAKSSVVTFSIKSKKLEVGKSYQLKLKKTKGIKIKKKSFSKKGKAIRISKKGKVTAKKSGKATVYCKVKYQRKGSKKIRTKKISCKIIVINEKKTNPNASTPSGQNTPKPYVAEPPIKVTPGPSGQVTPKPSGEFIPKPSGESTSKPSEESTPKPSEELTPKPSEELTPKPSEESTPKPDTTTTPKPNPTPTSGSADLEFSKPAFELVHKMGAGINLGNTMEAYCAGAVSTTQLETHWGQPVTTQAMITGMKGAGFHTLRIPVSWSSMMSNDGKYTIDSRLLERVGTIIQYAFQEDMYVIVNIHWDGQWWGQFGDADSSVREQAWARYEAFWTQISEYYKDYSDHLIFESANEELGGRLNDDWNMGAEQTGILTTDECYQTVNEINQKFVDIVRASGGNNAERFLLIAGYNTDIVKTCDSRYVMPQDMIPGHLLISVHYYSPATYCLVDKEDNSWGYMGSWGTDDDKTVMKGDLSAMKRCFVDHGYPVVIGEYGVADTKVDANTYVRKEGRDQFFQTLCEYALNSGMCPMLWDVGGTYDKSSCQIKNETEAANYLALEKEAIANEVYVPAEQTGEPLWSGTLKNLNYNQHVVSTDDSSTFTIFGYGGCFAINGIKWDDYQNPVVEIFFEGMTGSCNCAFATDYAGEGSWPHIEKADLYEGRCSFQSTNTIELPAEQLSGNLYFNLNGENFEGKVSIKIKEKSI